MMNFERMKTKFVVWEVEHFARRFPVKYDVVLVHFCG